ncbi:hypothetical protein CLOM_g24552 [Closterium sp. NIES-68]|nr:hypothetical protein CLOM_g24552 [Closterium sp. NIES-68]
MEELHFGAPLEASLFQLVDWVSVLELLVVWGVFLAVQVAKQHTADCSAPYWLLNLLQAPVALLATFIGAWRLYKRSHPSASRSSRAHGQGAGAGEAGRIALLMVLLVVLVLVH